VWSVEYEMVDVVNYDRDWVCCVSNKIEREKWIGNSAEFGE